MCECQKNKSCKVGKGLMFGLAALMGVGFGLFMGKKTGKELRKEIYDSWEHGENPQHAKFRIFFRELLSAFRSVPEAFDEFINCKPMKGYKAKGEEIVKEYKEKGEELMEKGEKFIDKKVKEGKKIIDQGKKVVTDLKKKIDM